MAKGAGSKRKADEAVEGEGEEEERAEEDGEEEDGEDGEEADGEGEEGSQEEEAADAKMEDAEKEVRAAAKPRLVLPPARPRACLPDPPGLSFWPKRAALCCPSAAPSAPLLPQARRLVRIYLL